MIYSLVFPNRTIRIRDGKGGLVGLACKEGSEEACPHCFLCPSWNCTLCHEGFGRLGLLGLQPT